jgi:hypothetical protein
VWSRAFRALTITVEISVDAETLVPAIVALTGSYPHSSATPSLVYSVEGSGPHFRILRDGEVMDDEAAAIDVSSILELDMLRSCVARATGCVVLHAAAVRVGDATVVMVGPSGAGKTTLTRGLLQTGAEYLSDECVAVGADGRVHGLARPICLEGVEDPSPDMAQVHQHRWVDADDVVVSDSFWHPPSSQGSEVQGQLKSLVVVHYVPDSSARREALSSGEALTRLWPCVLNPSPSTLDMLTSLVEAETVFEVRTSSVDSACTLVRRGLP